ncbi:peptidoglycan editing factor PgeF [Novosphingobium sp. TH158]|uniref:peptidoglycan editing factor PgeF n=1 Tax=Novosphingobium sp. TH158 TaxID=2067455 RepID=UPI000C7CABA8|nr:peptidoglycan editing factor PgeF [Novosphingobium sp. TH158]PLK27040.1 peptidoglycan editing factor PgeF [Novosphingobium sp. TH158]
MADPVEVIRAKVLDGVPHGFLGRRGGISVGEVAGLNAGLGAGDADGAVAENRARAVAAVLPGARLATVYQVHSPDCVVVTEPWPIEARPHADAMVTDRPGLLLGIVTADCAPVLLADREAGVIGAAHAGWKGAIGGVTDRTIEAMEGLGARRERIAAAIGPCIARASYEVDDGFRERFIAQAPAMAGHFLPGRPGRWQFDLEGYVAARLQSAGIGAIEPLHLDTYADEARFFSYRRATHLGQANYGRQLSLIGL